MSQHEKVTIHCYGKCGRSVMLRKSKIHQADYYLCHSRQDGVQCEKSLPALEAGKVREVDMYAAASFWGYRDIWPDAEIAASLIRAREILAGGLAKVVIEKAAQCN